MYPNGRAFPRRLEHDRQSDARTSACLDNFPLRSRNFALIKPLFRLQLVERCLASVHTFAGVANATILQNLLELAILAKSSVNSIECHVDPIRQFEIVIF